MMAVVTFFTELWGGIHDCIEVNVQIWQMSAYSIIDRIYCSYVDLNWIEGKRGEVEKLGICHTIYHGIIEFLYLKNKTYLFHFCGGLHSISHGALHR